MQLLRISVASNIMPEVSTERELLLKPELSDPGLPLILLMYVLGGVAVGKVQQ